MFTLTYEDGTTKRVTATQLKAMFPWVPKSWFADTFWRNEFVEDGERIIIVKDKP